MTYKEKLLEKFPKINHVGIVNITKPTTKGEVKVNVIIEPIDEEYMAWFIEQLKLKVKKIRFTKDNPELESMLWMNNPFSYRQ